VPKRDTSPFRKAFAFAPLNPGDSIVMPERVFKPGFLRELRDLTEIVVQLGLGAAAVNTLK